MAESGDSCKDGWGLDLFIYERMPKLGRASDVNTGSPSKCELSGPSCLPEERAMPAAFVHVSHPWEWPEEAGRTDGERKG